MTRMIAEKVPVGKFEIKSGKVVVSDPCYSRGTWCAGEIDKVQNGTWYAFVSRSLEENWGDEEGYHLRCAEIEVVHESMMDYDKRGTRRDRALFLLGWATRRAARAEKEISEFLLEMYQERLGPDWKKTDILVGVDSGQAGIFDDPKYVGRDVSEHEGSWYNGSEYEGSWYGDCCELTLKFPGAGVLDGGVVSSSGYGDGGYDCFTQTQRGKVVGIKIVFIPEEYEDEES